MAVQHERDAETEALASRAAAEIKRLNPRIGEPVAALSEEEYARAQQETRELERIWDELDGQRGGPVTGEPAAEAVSADRGE
jgi:hypothetical protein